MAPYGNRIVDFAEEGVTFIFPPQLDNVIVVRLPLPAENPVGKNPSVFDPKRVFAKFKLYRTINDTTIEPILKFTPPFVLEIHYKGIDDTAAATQKRNKVCAYYDATKGVQDWVSFAKHGFQPSKYSMFITNHRKKKKAGFKGFGTAKINDWPDPEMGWGP